MQPFYFIVIINVIYFSSVNIHKKEEYFI